MKLRIDLHTLVTINFIFYFQLKEDYKEEYLRNGRPVQRTEAIDELRNAFDLAERSCPGITDELVAGLFNRFTVSSLSDSDIRRAVERVKR